MNKAGKIQGVGAKFNNSHDKVIASYDHNSKPVGWTKTYVDSIDNKVKYQYYNKDGTIRYEGDQFVTNYSLPDDKFGFKYDGRAGYSRSNMLFSGLLSNGMPVIGRLTFECDHYKWTFEG